MTWAAVNVKSAFMFSSFPKTRLEFEARFTKQEDCLDYLAKLRWPDGFVCPKCGHDRHWSANRERYICTACRHQTSVTAGTIFHKTRKPLALWFRAIWYMTVQKHGSNALGLQRELGLGSYHTAWEWFHKLRQAMIRPDRDLLGGLVEVDETYVGAPEPGKPGRGAADKALVAVAVEDKGKQEGFGRIRLQRIPDASGASLTGFAMANIAPGSLIRTDGWRGYSRLKDHGFDHQALVGGESEEKVGEGPLPLCHRVISLVKRVLLGAYQGAVHPEQLDRYLEEFTFRFNRRTARHRTLLIFRVLQNAVVHPPFPAKEIELGLRTYMRGRMRGGTKRATSENHPTILPSAIPALEGLGDIPF